MDSSKLKIDRAREHIADLKKRIRKKHPFTYVLETDTETAKRSTFCKRDESMANIVGIIVGDIIHNLRSAIDHAYWYRVGPFATTPQEEKKVQFPFFKDRTGLGESVKEGMAARVSDVFTDAIISLEPHCGSGGNHLLYSIHELDIIDKHKILLPAIDSTKLIGSYVRRIIPDFPPCLRSMTLSQNKRDVVWPADISSKDFIKIKRSTKGGTHHKALPIPVDIVFSLGTFCEFKPMIPLLDQFADVADSTIHIILNS